MAEAIIYECVVYEDFPMTALARITGSDGNNLQQADLTSIAYTVRDNNDSGASEVTSGTLTIADVVFDSLQTDARWTKDSTGYNFRATIPAAAFPSTSDYRVQITFTETTGETFPLWFDATVLDNKAS